MIPWNGSGIYNRYKVVTDNTNIPGFGDPQIINEPLQYPNFIYNTHELVRP